MDEKVLLQIFDKLMQCVPLSEKEHLIMKELSKNDEDARAALETYKAKKGLTNE